MRRLIRNNLRSKLWQQDPGEKWNNVQNRRWPGMVFVVHNFRSRLLQTALGILRKDTMNRKANRSSKAKCDELFHGRLHRVAGRDNVVDQNGNLPPEGSSPERVMITLRSPWRAFCIVTCAIRPMSRLPPPIARFPHRAHEKHLAAPATEKARQNVSRMPHDHGHSIDFGH